MLPPVLRSSCASLLSIAVVVAIAGCGGSSSSSAAQFPAQALGVCTKIAPRVKATTASVSALDASAGSSLNKLPQLATLLGQLSTELSDLHSGLSGLTPPSAQKPAYAVFLGDLNKLQGLTQTGAGYLKGGTISGLQKFQRLSSQLSSASTALSTDGGQVPGLAACKNVGQ
jgi:hypothetical protein